jgi:prevent-host-death family protein
MDVSIAEAKNRLPKLIRAVEGGEIVVITRRGKPVAQITPLASERRPIQWDAIRERIKLPPAGMILSHLNIESSRLMKKTRGRFGTDEHRGARIENKQLAWRPYPFSSVFIRGHCIFQQYC